MYRLLEQMSQSDRDLAAKTQPAIRDAAAFAGIDFDKEKFLGRDAIIARRSSGPTKKIIGVGYNGPVENLMTGTPIFDGDEKVSEVTTSCFSHVLQSSVGLAVFPTTMAYSGLSFHLGAPDGPEIKTISMPPIMPKSLSVKLDEM